MNKNAREAGVPEAPLRDKGRVKRSPGSDAFVERSASLEGVLARRRAAQAQIDALLTDGGTTADAMPRRVTGELGFILHAWDWSETSLLLDVLTARFGRVFLVAKGARRASSQYRGLLTAFCPLRFTWSGQKEAKVLIRAEWQGSMTPLTGEALLSGFYVNELILKLTAREERHPGLFQAYVDVLHSLALDERDAVQPALRQFERRLLTVAGWAPVRAGDEKAAWFAVRDGVLFGLSDKSALLPDETAYSAAAAEAVVTGVLSASVMRGTRDILRELIRFHLDGRSVHSRRILAELHRLRDRF